MGSERAWNRSLQDPLGKRGTELHRWLVGTKTFKAMFGKGGGSEGVDETFAHRSMDGFGAFILGRNMFGPVRGEWLDDSWKGWWGDNPPYHAPTFVLTHHAREPIVMEGGTTFHFVTDGIHAALERARDAAGARDVKIGGGVSQGNRIWNFLDTRVWLARFGRHGFYLRHTITGGASWISSSPALKD